ncbi:ParB/RepB/Spo0J family partition protein [Streptomyces sp. AD55]|uniref:ParB/RepB/Spo0J family partition protein n=1 Tax=Streptomyces sp. AD55 TaxID=3242895 RepID=UPI003527B62E
MSKAETLGPAPSFSPVRSARRQAINKIGGENNGEAITELPVTQISENPDNPRNHLRNLDETVESVRKVGVILPIVVATTDAYLRDRADRVDDLDAGAQYVVIDGHRRLEASRRVGLATIPVRVDNARVATDEALLEAAFVANYHRDDMTELEEAHALKQLVEYYGSQTKASERLGIPQGTLSTKLSLLKLSPELQKDLMTGERKVEHVRNLGKLSPPEQKAKADERAAAARKKSERNPEPVEERVPGPADYHAVIIPEPVEAAREPVQAEPVMEPTAPAPVEAVTPVVPAQSPVPAPAGSEDVPALRRFPYEDGEEAARYLIRKMPAAEFERMLRACTEHWERQSTTS